jgi:hypothetical protein
MKKQNIVTAILMLGGGFLVFYLLKPKKDAIIPTSDKKTSFEGPATPPDMKNAEIVASAYSEALKASEPPAVLTELNKEMTKEFGMRCYVSDSGAVVVCDAKGNTILTK